MLEIPGTNGAGLDGARIAIALGALAVLSLTIRLVAGLAHQGRRHRRLPSRYEH